MTTSVTTTKKEEFFNSLYTPEEMEYNTLAKVKDEILNIMDDDVQWEIKRLGSGRRILKMITTADFWSGTWLGEVETICRSMSLTWWMSDCLVFNNEILPYSKVALNVSTLKLACN